MSFFAVRGEHFYKCAMGHTLASPVALEVCPVDSCGNKLKPHYGQLQYLVSLSVVTYSRLCIECGRSLAGKRSDARFCSPACRQSAYRERKEREEEAAMFNKYPVALGAMKGQDDE